MNSVTWTQIQTLQSKSYTCGYCENPIASQHGYSGTINIVGGKVFIYVCHKCFQATFFDKDGKQTPGASFGESIKHIPDTNVEGLYNEARDCFKIKAYTSCVMCSRKLLMNIAVSEGADAGKSFVDYVNFLDSKGFIPPKGKAWVDKIRKIGNEANHSIEFKSAEDAQLILTFTTMLLKFIYEMPGLLGIP